MKIFFRQTVVVAAVAMAVFLPARGFAATSARSTKSSASSSKISVASVPQTAAVIQFLPPSAQKPVSGFIGSIERFRITEAEKLTASRNKAETSLLKDQALALEQKAASGAALASAQSASIPLASFSVFFFSLLAWIVAVPLAFYIISLLILFFIVRFVVRKTRKGRRYRRPAASREFPGY